MTSADQVFAQAVLMSDEVLYMLVHLPPAAITAGAGVLAEIGTAFSALIVDSHEVTLLVPQDVWDDYRDRLPDHRTEGGWRLITFDLPLGFELIGFLALVSRLLANAGVPILALSAFERDHVLVPAAFFQTAWEVLTSAQHGHLSDM